MRSYVATTAQGLGQFLSTSRAHFESLYAPTVKFQSAHPDYDEEESEYALSLMAASDALRLRQTHTDPVFVLALEIPDEMIIDHLESSIILRDGALWQNVECAFLVSEDGEDLTWFATQEISQNLPSWLVD